MLPSWNPYRPSREDRVRTSPTQITARSRNKPNEPAKQRDKFYELAKWRLDPSLIEFLKDPGHHTGISTISRAVLASTANTSSSSIELGDHESGMNSSGENRTRKLISVEKRNIKYGDSREQILKSTLREARILVELSHDNVIKLEGFVEDIAHERVWLIYPWQEYGNLKEFVASQDWEVPERISLMHDVTQGVEYLHSRDPPICHYDLKSFNVLVTSNCRAVITGFNSARRINNSGLDQQTENEDVGFTTRWAAPELFIDDGCKSGLWSDIWALAWVFYEIMTSRIPFQDTRLDSAVIIGIVRGDLSSFKNDTRISLIPTLGGLLIKCWNSDPRARPTAEGCRELLDWAPKTIPNPLRFSESAATTKAQTAPYAVKSPSVAEEKMGGHPEAEGDQGYPSPSQHPSTVDPRHLPTRLTSTPIEATNEDHSQDAMPTETPDGSETVLRSILGIVAHLSVAPDQLTIIDSAEVGRGGYGDVLLATLNRPSQMPIQVAVKELRTVATGGVRNRLALRLARELKIWAKVNHPNILPLIGYYLSEDRGIARLISPLMTNGNVSQYLEKTQPGVLKRLDILRDITAGMDYLHGHIPPICHADLKPPNILINDTLQAVLCDFGLASFIQEAGVSSGLTTSQNIKGTFRYMSPELNLDDDAKHTLASDVWAWGCTAFEIMTGCVPYKKAAKNSKVLLAIEQKKLPGSIKTVMSQLMDNTSVDDVPASYGLPYYLSRCWDFDAEQRPPMSRILHELFPNTVQHTTASP